MILLTGAAGFIGYHTACALLARGESVVGVDSLNDYYDPALKHARLDLLKKHPAFTFYPCDIARPGVLDPFLTAHPEINRIVHLAAQAGVRYSIDHPFAYERSNLAGQLVLLEAARRLSERERLTHFVYASSSSVYGGNTKIPFSVGDPVDQPVSLYAATKRAAELMTQTYAHLYGIAATGLRFFTVYGPWGRPDMAYYTFTRDIFAGKPIEIFNYGDMKRDFTWIEDIVSGLLAALDAPPKAHAPLCIGGAPHRIFNLGNNHPESLLEFVTLLESTIGQRAEKIMRPMQAGDVRETYADIESTRAVLGFSPRTPLGEGIPKFVTWYRAYHRL